MSIDNDDTEMDNILKKLHSQVSEFTHNNTTLSEKDNNYSSRFKFNITYLFYLLIPVTICILFILIKPRFIMNVVNSDNDNTKLQISIKKLLIYTLILSSVIIFGIFIYIYRKK